jgi:hypothetical protein
MTLLRKLLAAAVCLAVLIAVGWSRLGSRVEPIADAAATGWRNEDCRRCHASVWQEWEASYHARAFTDDNVQAAFQHFGHDRKCESCHAPEPIFLTGLSQPVEFRAEHRQSGVDCLSCHATGDNRQVAALRTVADAPCHPVDTPALATSQACAGCHVAIFADWQASRFAAEGRTCQTCHMPRVTDRPGGSSHHCLGSHDDRLVRSGARMRCRVEQDELVVDVTNHATGHNFPGERHNRVLYLQVIENDAAGGVALARQELIKGITPFRGESSAERIKPGETFTARFPLIDAAKTAEVKLLYRRFPWQSDREALVVHEETMSLSSENTAAANP